MACAVGYDYALSLLFTEFDYKYIIKLPIRYVKDLLVKTLKRKREYEKIDKTYQAYLANKVDRQALVNVVNKPKDNVKNEDIVKNADSFINRMAKKGR